MVRIKSHLWFSILLLSFVAGHSTSTRLFAQASDATKGDKETEKRRDIEKKTRALLDEVANAAWSLELPENRVFVLSTTAGLLWPNDEKRARNLFWDALNSLNLPAASKELAGKDQQSTESATENADTDPAKKPAAKSPTKDQLKAMSRYYEVY